MRLLGLALVLVLSGCGYSAKVGTKEQKDQALRATRPSAPGTSVYFLYFTASIPPTPTVHINKQKVTFLNSSGFTRVELPFGPHLVEVAWNNGPSVIDTISEWRLSPNDRKAWLKRATKTFYNSAKSEGAYLLKIGTGWFDAPSGQRYFSSKGEVPTRADDKAIYVKLKDLEYGLPMVSTVVGNFAPAEDQKSWAAYKETMSVDSLRIFIKENPDNVFIVPAGERLAERGRREGRIEYGLAV